MPGADQHSQKPAQAGEPGRGRLVALPGGPREVNPPNNLPSAVSSFVGRGQEMESVTGLLRGHRLLTLTGSGGSGKTRLALAVASNVAGEFEDGVWLVELASLSDPNLVGRTVASVLGIREEPDRTFSRALAETVGSDDMLLVLDNCEHLLDACAELADVLLRSCPNLRVLATSREPLGIVGENSWLVPTLGLPDPAGSSSAESLRRYPATELFIERARAVTSDFAVTGENAEAIAQTCRRLDGIPLAIELAAARTRVLSPGQIAARLDDSFALLTGGGRTMVPRHKTLRETITWSHELLSERERVLFRRLSAFAGDFTLEAAEDVCAGDGIESQEVLDLLMQLIDKSLVLVAQREGEVRYRLLEMMRQYGAEELGGSVEAERVRGRHARHYLAMAEEADPDPREQGAWLRRLETEHANCSAALRWALEDDTEESAGERVQVGLRLAVALAQGRFWNAHGPSEGRYWLERGLARSGSSPSPIRARAMNEAGWIAIFQGDYEQAVALLEEGIAVCRELGDGPGAALSLVQLGRAVLHAGDHERVKTLSKQAGELREGLTDPQAVSYLLLFMGTAALDEGDIARTVTLCEEGLDLSRESGDGHRAAMCLTILGLAALERGDHRRAASLYEEDLRLLRGLKDRAGITYGLQGLAGAAALQGRSARAARLWEAAEALRESSGQPRSSFDRAHPGYDDLLAAARSSLNEAEWEAARAEGRAMTLEQAIDYALEGAGPPLPRAAKEPAPGRPFHEPLTSRELEVLGLISSGLTNQQIASRLFIAVSTVKSYVNAIFRKLEVANRTQAVARARELRLIPE